MDGVYLLNESAVWTNRFDKNDSVIHSFAQSKALFANESGTLMNQLNLNDSLINQLASTPHFETHSRKIPT